MCIYYPNRLIINTYELPFVKFFYQNWTLPTIVTFTETFCMSNYEGLVNLPPVLAEWLGRNAADVWDRIKFCRNQTWNRVFETTLTQNMVFSFYQLEKYENFPVTIYESTNEKRNGNDLEFIFAVDGQWLHVPCQCKILNKQFKYPGIYHRVKDQYQIDLLLKYARINDGIPIYLFYNYYPDPDFNQSLADRWQADFRHFGCSFISAWNLKERFFNNPSGPVPSFIDLHSRHPHFDQSALPFYTLGGFLSRQGIASFKKRYRTKLDFVSSPPHYHLQDDLNLDGWDPLIPPAAIGRIPQRRWPQDFDFSFAESDSFTPAYRLVFEI